MRDKNTLSPERTGIPDTLRAAKRISNYTLQESAETASVIAATLVLSLLYRGYTVSPEMFEISQQLTSDLLLPTASFFWTYESLRRLRDLSRIEKSERFQDTVRETLNEPIDIFQHHDKDTTTLRWYGADKVNRHADDEANVQLVKRLEDIADYVRSEQISQVAMSADWLREAKRLLGGRST